MPRRALFTAVAFAAAAAAAFAASTDAGAKANPPASAHQHVSSSSGNGGGACQPLSNRDAVFLGTGRCVDAGGNTPDAFACLVPGICPQGPLGDAQACALVCRSLSTCTGYEIRVPDNATQGTVPTCFVFAPSAPTMGAWPWALVAGTQVAAGGSGRAVAGANGAQQACCYKRPYPQASPLDNPVPTPPMQTARQVQIFSNNLARAKAASDGALPILSSLIDFCAEQYQ